MSGLLVNVGAIVREGERLLLWVYVNSCPASCDVVVQHRLLASLLICAVQDLLRCPPASSLDGTAFQLLGSDDIAVASQGKTLRC